MIIGYYSHYGYDYIMIMVIISYEYGSIVTLVTNARQYWSNTIAGKIVFARNYCHG